MGKRKRTKVVPMRLMLPRTTDLIGMVEKMLGFDRVSVRILGGKVMLCRIRGKMKKRVWIRVNDVVLVSPWDFQPEKGDIFYRYTREQVKLLKKRGYIPKDYGRRKRNETNSY